MSRSIRRVAVALAALAATATLGTTALASAGGGHQQVRVVADNTWCC